MIDLQASSTINSLFDFNRQVSLKKKKKEKIIQLSALSISHSHKQKKLNNFDVNEEKKKPNGIENPTENIKVKVNSLKSQKINDLDIINEFKQLSSSTWSFERSNKLLNTTTTTTATTTTTTTTTNHNNNNSLPSPTLSTASSSDGSFEFDSDSILAFPMPPPPRSTVNIEFNRQTSLPSTPLHNIPFTPNGLRRFPSPSQLSSRPSIPISKAFDPSQPPQLPLPPLPSTSSPSTLSFGFPSIPLRSSSLNFKPSPMLNVHKQQPVLSTSSVKQEGILGGLAIDTSYTKMHCSIRTRDDYFRNKDDCSVIKSPIESNQPDLDTLTPTYETCNRHQTTEDQHQQVGEQDIAGPLSSSRQEKPKRSCELDTMDKPFLSERLLIDSAGADDLRATPRPTDQHLDDDDLLASSYDSINWQDVVMLPEEDDLFESVERLDVSQPVQVLDSKMGILDQSFSQATSSYMSSHEATSSNVSQLTPNSSAELDTPSPSKRSSLKSTSNKHYSTFSVGDLSEWIRQHHGSLESQSGQLQSDEDESEIDLEESLDRLAKRLGYQGESTEDHLSRPISFQEPSSPSSPSNLPATELDDDYDRDEFFSTMEDSIIPGGENKVILSLGFSPTFNPEPSDTRSDGRTRSSSSTCSFTTNSTTSILTPITPIEHKPFHSHSHDFPQTKLRHQFSLSKLDLGKTNTPILEHKRSSLSLATQSNAHSKFKPAYRPQPMKVIEEPSSSDEEEFDLSLDHPPRPSKLPSSLPFASKTPAIKPAVSSVPRATRISLSSTLPRPQSTFRRPAAPLSLQSNPTQSNNLVSRQGSSRPRSGTIHETSFAANAQESGTPLAFGFAKTATPRGAPAKTMIKAPRVQLSTPNLRSSIPKPSFTKSVNSHPASSNATSANLSKASPKLPSSLIKPKMSQDLISSATTETERRIPSLSSSVGSSIPSRLPFHPLRNNLLDKRESRQLRAVSQPLHCQIDVKPVSNVSSSVTPTMPQPECNLSPPGVMSPPGKPASLEYSTWLSSGPCASDEPINSETHDAQGARPASASIFESFGRVSKPELSRRASLGTAEPSFVASHSSTSNVTQPMSPAMTTDENRRMSSKWSRNMTLQSESISEAPEDESQPEELTSPTMTSGPSSAERKLRLKPLFLGSSPLHGDRDVSCEPTLRLVRSRASLPPTSANSVTSPNYQSPKLPPYLSRRSSNGFSPTRPMSFTAGFNSNMFVNEKNSSFNNGERSPKMTSHTRNSPSISIRQLTYN
ncbi:hypothetical protein DFH28DRAFT_910395 [Melampsora americana]|nr:hypothetical protein DFH28DRAFT_910395 [Melampsora americana]